MEAYIPAADYGTCGGARCVTGVAGPGSGPAAVGAQRALELPDRQIQAR